MDGTEMEIEMEPNIQGDIVDAMPEREEMEICFSGLSYTVKMKKKKKSKKILDDLNGVFHCGELIAVMGCSGAGKSSFVDLIAGDEKTGKVEGTVKIGGRNASSCFKKIGSYVRQQDVFSPTLTVEETFKFYAELLVDGSKEDKKRIVRKLIADLNLEKSADTLIGNELTRGISGGEMKRVAIGSALVSNPSVLILDEPTSGLDSNTAHSIVQYLRALTRGRRTVICTIHQPSASTFFLFDKVLLLHHGRTVFFGPTLDVVPYFASLGFQCPQYANPADFMIETVDNAFVPDPDKFFDFAEAYAKGDTVQRIKEDAETRLQNNVQLDDIQKKYIANPFYQFAVFCWRNWIQFVRDKRLSTSTLVMAVVSALLIGIIFLRIDYDCYSIRSRFGALFLLLFVATQMAMPWFYLVFETRPIFIRERKTHNISILAYYFAQSLGELPLYICTLIEAAIPYYMVGFRAPFQYYLIYMCIVLTNIFVMTGIVIFGGSVASNLGVGMIIIMALFGLSTLFSGFFVQITQLPVFLRWLTNLSFIKYSLELIVVNEFYGQYFPERLTNITEPDGNLTVLLYCNGTTGEQSISLLGFSEPVFIWRNFIILYSMLFFFRALAFLAMYFMHK